MAAQKNKSIVDTEKFAQLVASKQGWVLNSDASFLNMIFEGLTVNYNRYGYYSCPCRDADGLRELDKDMICPCLYSRRDIEDHGHCYCGLFLSEEFIASGKTPASIPDRRNDESD